MITLKTNNNVMISFRPADVVAFEEADARAGMVRLYLFGGHIILVKQSFNEFTTIMEKAAKEEAYGPPEQEVATEPSVVVAGKDEIGPDDPNYPPKLTGSAEPAF